VLSGFERILLAVLILVLMTGMGASLTGTAFRAVLRRPRGILIGVLSQFGWMPLIAFGLASALSLEATAALGLLIVGSTPGGTTSNLFTYYARADLALSISMTAVSTVVAVVMMPLVLSLYGPMLAAEGAGDATPFAVPYTSIMTTLLVVLVPVAIGMYIRHRSERVAAIVERVGSLAGVAVLILLVVSGLIRNSSLLTELPAGVYVATIGLSVIGITLGYGSAALLGLATPSRRAIGLETGIQNSPLALAIIVATFPAGEQAALMTPVLVYAFFVLVVAATVTAAWRLLAPEQ
jgi:BASS family bile acid:Na+ symporter